MRIIGSMSESDPRVDAYLAALPADQRQLLEGVRAAVRRLVPDAEDTISYDMPAFRLDGRFLLSYAGWKRHCSLYPLDDALLERHADAIRSNQRTKGSLHFSADKPLPDALLRDLVEARASELRRGAEY